MAKVYTSLLETKERRGGGFFLLLDPDRLIERDYLELAEAAEDCGVDALLVGTSFMFSVNFHQAIKQIKQATNLPVIIFPGSFAQVAGRRCDIVFLVDIRTQSELPYRRAGQRRTARKKVRH